MEKRLCKLNCSFGKVSHALNKSSNSMAELTIWLRFGYDLVTIGYDRKNNKSDHELDINGVFQSVTFLKVDLRKRQTNNFYSGLLNCPKINKFCHSNWLWVLVV